MMKYTYYSDLPLLENSMHHPGFTKMSRIFDSMEDAICAFFKKFPLLNAMWEANDISIMYHGDDTAIIKVKLPLNVTHSYYIVATEL